MHVFERLNCLDAGIYDVTCCRKRADSFFAKKNEDTTITRFVWMVLNSCALWMLSLSLSFMQKTVKSVLHKECFGLPFGIAKVKS